MQTYLSQRNYLSPAAPYAGAIRQRGRVARIIGDLGRSLYRRWQRRKMIDALQALDDRLLHDMGIRRGEIRYVVGRFTDEELGMTPVSRATAATPEADGIHQAG